VAPCPLCNPGVLETRPICCLEKSQGPPTLFGKTSWSCTLA